MGRKTYESIGKPLKNRVNKDLAKELEEHQKQLPRQNTATDTNSTGTRSSGISTMAINRVGGDKENIPSLSVSPRDGVPEMPDIMTSTENHTTQDSNDHEHIDATTPIHNPIASSAPSHVSQNSLQSDSHTVNTQMTPIDGGTTSKDSPTDQLHDNSTSESEPPQPNSPRKICPCRLN